MKEIVRACALGVALLVAAGAARAQEPAYGQGGVEINGHAGLLNLQGPDFGTGETTFEVEDQVLFGGRLGYTAPFGLFIQAEGDYTQPTLTTSAARLETDVLRYGGALGYNFQVAKPFQFFLVGGAGALRIEPAGMEAETRFSYNFGGGLRLFLTPALALRADVRDHVLPDAFIETRQALSPGVTIAEETTHNVEVTGGISLFLGGGRDSDGDGVRDSLDRCPDTPRVATVDDNGCPIDTDRDGVADYVDRCADTPDGARVNAEGCPTDADEDGVFDGLDQCPETPAGATVDERGCPTDADGDGVFDGIDQCPETPAGAMADSAGCPTDGDSDGVLDGLDLCPNTPADREVDENGCTIIEAGIEAGRLVLHNVHFDFDKATLRPDARTVLDDVGNALVDRPDVRIEIQGHTDAIGTDAYNRDLSQRRAEAVLDYLLTHFPTLDRTRLTARGYGESSPIAPNDTEEGRAQNRRVEFVVLGQGS